jgi:hypothetical protein
MVLWLPPEKQRNKNLREPLNIKWSGRLLNTTQCALYALVISLTHLRFQIIDRDTGTTRERPFRSVNQPQLINHRNTAIHHRDLILSGKRLSRITRQHCKAQPASNRLKQQADLIATTLR